MKKLVIALGCFDGVHKGHQKLISTTLEKAKVKTLESSILMFDPLPQKIFDAKFKPLQTFSDRAKIINELGIQNHLVVNTNKDFLETTAEEFVLFLKHKNVESIVVGSDFRFGKGRQGDIHMLEQHFDLTIVPTVFFNNIRISSTWCKKLIYNSDFWEFEKIVGRKWSFSIDLKQSNLVPDIMLPSSNKIAIRAISKDHNVPGYIENKMVFTPDFELVGKSDIISDLS